MSIPVKGKTIIVADVVQPSTKRIYPADELQKAVDRFNESKKLHGTFFNCQFDITEDMPNEKTAIQVDSLKMDGGALVCDFTIMDTPFGVLMQKYIHDHKFQLTPRGVGKQKVNKDGSCTINDYTLISVDVKLM